MKFKTIGNRGYMNHEFYINQPMNMVELNLNLLIVSNPHLINSKDRSINHPLIRKHSNIPFNIQQL